MTLIKKMTKTIVFFGFLLLCFPKAWCMQTTCLFSAGDDFPEIIFQAMLTPMEKQYLGISDNLRETGDLNKFYSFTLFDIQTELIIVEFLNVYCFSCQTQAPVLNRVYESIQKDNNLRGRVKILGICPGNNFREIKKFKKEKAVQFPLIPDPDFQIYETVGGQCGTPFILMVRRTEKQSIITWSHIGQISSPLYFVQEVWDALQADLHTIVKKAREKGLIKVTMERPEPYCSDMEIKKKISLSMESRGLKLRELKKVALSNDEYVFIGKAIGQDGEKTFFSKMISRNSVCDICHAIHFILTFDDRGVIVDFDPVHITKYGNMEWNISEIIRTRKKLIGKSILKPLGFNPEVDAVSLATMSSALIFNSIERAKKYYRELQQKGYISQ